MSTKDLKRWVVMPRVRTRGQKDVIHGNVGRRSSRAHPPAVRAAAIPRPEVGKIGNQKHFQANARAPVFASVRDLVLKTSGLADVLRSALAAVAPEIRAAFVYGSVARNEDSGDSDVDLMVISDGLAYADLFAALEAVARRLGRPVNPTLYSGAEFAQRVRKQNAFVVRMLAQPKIWVIGSEDDLTAR